MTRDAAYSWCAARQVTIMTGVVKGKPWKVSTGLAEAAGVELEDAVQALIDTATLSLQAQIDALAPAATVTIAVPPVAATVVADPGT